MSESLIELVEEFKRLDHKRKLLGKLPLPEAERLDNLRSILAQRLHGVSESDRRKELRIPTSMRVRYRTGESFVHNYISNLSSGGVFISTPKPLPLNTNIKLHLVFEDKHEEIEVEGKVVWENTQGGRFSDITKPGMGVKFQKVPEVARNIIDNLIHESLTEQAHAEEVKRGKPGAAAQTDGKKEKTHPKKPR